jgi:hypothetical protein
MATFEGIRGESQHCDECHAFERATAWIDEWHGGMRVRLPVQEAIQFNSNHQTSPVNAHP